MNESFQHAGVLGMRWGVRSDRSNSSGSNHSADHETVANIRRKKVSELSNQEIKQLLDRSLLEKQYRDLHPSLIAKGGKMIADVLLVSGKAEAQKYANKYVPIAVSLAIANIKKLKP